MFSENTSFLTFHAEAREPENPGFEFGFTASYPQLVRQHGLVVPDWDRFCWSGNPLDSQGQPPPLPRKILLYLIGETLETEKYLWQNKRVDLKSSVRYRWNRQNRAFARRLSIPRVFSDITFPTGFSDESFAVCCLAAVQR